MPNSAITFNTSGLASASSPGLVGTGTQTFAGKKTFDGGAAIKSDSSGTAISSGYVGEVVQFKGATTGSISSGNYYSIGGTILQPGTYQILLNVQSNGSALTSIAGCISTTATTNTTINAVGVTDGDIDYLYAGAYSSGSNTIRASSSLILRVTTATTYYIRVAATGSPGTNFGWATALKVA